MGVTFLFEVDWLSDLGVIGIFLVLRGGSFLPPFFEILKSFLIQNKNLWWVSFLFEVDWLRGLGD